MTDDFDRLIKQFGDEVRRVERRGAQRRPPVRRVIAVAAVTGLLGGVVLSALPGSGGGEAQADVVANARAALAQKGDMLHMVVVSSALGPDGKRIGGTSTWVTWRTAKPLRYRTTYSIRNKLIDEFSYADNVKQYYSTKAKRLRTWTGVKEPSQFGPNNLEPADGNPTSIIQARLSDGTLTDAGLGDLGGVPVRRLVGSTPPEKGVPATLEFEYAVDPDTYTPVQFRLISRARRALEGPNGQRIEAGQAFAVHIEDFKVYEHLPVTTESLRQLKIRPPKGTKISKPVPWKKRPSR